MKIEQIFGEVLKEERNKKDISQSELPNLAELDRTYISLLERGLRQPTIETVFKLAEALNLKASDLIQKIETIMKIDREKRFLAIQNNAEEESYLLAMSDLKEAIAKVVWPIDNDSFVINPKKLGNGVKPIKENL